MPEFGNAFNNMHEAAKPDPNIPDDKTAQTAADPEPEPVYGSKFGLAQFRSNPTPLTDLGTYSDARQDVHFDPKEFERISPAGVFNNQEGLITKRAAEQGKMSAILGFLNQAVVGEIIGGTVQGAGSIYESVVGEIVNKVNGESSDFNNWAIQLGSDIQKWSQTSTPIYRENPNKAFDIGDFGWWASNAVSVASTLSLMIPATGVVKGIGWLGKIAGIADKVGDTARYWSKVGISSAVMRNGENYREALDVTNNARQKAMDEFGSMSEQEYNKFLLSETGQDFMNEMPGANPTRENVANYIAAKAGWTSYRVNSSNYIFDVLQTAALYRGLSGRTRTGATTKGVRDAQAALVGKTATRLERFSNAVKPITGAFAAQFTEGLEEVVNTIGSKKGEEKGAALIKGKRDIDLLGNIGDIVKDPHTLEAGFWGILGGVGFHTVYSRFTADERRNTANAKLAEIAGRNKSIVDVRDTLNEIYGSTATPMEKKALARQEIYKTGMSMGLAAARTGNVDLLLDSFEYEDFNKKTTNGLRQEELNAMGFASTQEVNSELKDAILQAEKFYNNFYNRIWTGKYSEATKVTMATLQTETAMTIAEKERAIQDLRTSLVPHNAFIANSNLNNDPNFQSSYQIAYNQNAVETINAAIESGLVPPSMAESLKRHVKTLEEKVKLDKDLIKTTSNPRTKLSGLEEAIRINADIAIREAIVDAYKDQQREMGTKEAALKMQETLENKKKEVEKQKEELFINNLKNASDITLNDFLTNKSNGLTKKQTTAVKNEIERRKKEKIAKDEADKRAAEKAATATANANADQGAIDVDSTTPEAPVAAVPTPTPAPTKSKKGPEVDTISPKELKDLQEEVELMKEANAKDPVQLVKELGYLIEILKMDRRYSDANPGIVMIREAIAQSTSDTTSAPTTPSAPVVESEEEISTKELRDLKEEVNLVIESLQGDPVATIKELNFLIKILKSDRKYTDNNPGILYIKEKIYEIQNPPKEEVVEEVTNNEEVTVIVQSPPNVVEQPAVPEQAPDTVETVSKREMAGVKRSVDTLIRKGVEAIEENRDFDYATALLDLRDLRNRYISERNYSETNEAIVYLDNAMAELQAQGKKPAEVFGPNVPVETVAEKVIDEPTPQKVDAFVDTKTQAGALGDALSLFGNAIRKNAPAGIPLTKEVVEAGTAVIKEAAKLGLVSFRDIARFVYERFPALFREIFDALKSVYFLLNGKQLQEGETEASIKAMTIEDIIQGPKVVSDDVTTPQSYDGANIFIPEASAGYGLKEVEPGVYQTSSAAGTEVIKALQEIGRIHNTGNPVEVELVVDEARTKELNQSIDDIDNRVVAIRYNGVTIGYLNTMKGVNASIAKGEKNKWDAPFMVKLQNNRLATQNLRQQVKPGKSYKAKIKRFTSGTKISGPETNPLQALPGAQYYITPMEYGSGKHSELTPIVGEGATFFGTTERQYEAGVVYALVDGFNGTGKLQSKIPVRLQRGTVTSQDATQVVNAISRAIKIFKDRAGNIDVFNDAELKEVKDEINNITAIRYDNISSGTNEIPSPIFNFYPAVRDANGVNKNLGRIDFLFENNKKLARIYINNNGAVTLQIFEWNSSQNRFQSNEELKAALGDVIPFNNGSKYLGLNEKTRLAFRKVLTSAIATKAYNIPIKAIQEGKVSFEELVNKGYLTTDTGKLLDHNGNYLSSFFGNPKRESENVQPLQNQISNNLELKIGTDLIEQSIDVVTQSTESVVPVEVVNDPMEETQPTETISTALEVESPTIAEETESVASTPDVDSIDDLGDLGLGDLENLDDTFLLAVDVVGNENLVTSIEQREENWKRIFGTAVKFDANIADLIFRQGKWAYGVFEHAMGKVVSTSPVGTEYHEAMHAIELLYLNEQQRADLYNEVRAMKGDLSLTDREVSEINAENFRAYMNLRDARAKIPFIGSILRFFEGLYNYARFILGDHSIYRVFKLADTRGFKWKPSIELVAYAQKQSYLMEVNPMDMEFNNRDLEAYKKYAAKIVMRYISKYGNITENQLKENPNLTPRKFVIKALADHYRAATDEIVKAEVLKMINLLRDENFKKNNFWKTIVDYVDSSLNYNIKINEDALIVENSDSRLTKAWDDRVAFGISSKESFDKDLKRLILTTDKVSKIENGQYVIASNNTAQLKESLNFDIVYPKLVSTMSNAVTIDEMMARLKALKDVDPTFALLYDRVVSDEITKAKWFTNFRKIFIKDRHYRVTPKTSGLNVVTDIANQNFRLADEWSVTIQAIFDMANNNIEEFKAFMEVADQKKEAVVQAIQNETGFAKPFVELLNLYGIGVTEETINKLVSNEDVRKDYMGNSINEKDFFDKELYRQFNVIHQRLSTFAKSENPGTIAFNEWGRLNNLAKYLTHYFIESSESSYINTTGNLVYSIQKPNYLSSFFDNIERFLNPFTVDKRQAAEDLLGLLAEYANDPSMKYSNWLFGDKGFLKVKREEYTLDDLQIENIEAFELAKFGGIKEIIQRIGKDYSEMSDQDWALGTLLTYLTSASDTVTVPILVQSDSGNIFTIKSKRYEGHGTIERTDAIFQALANTIRREMAAMKQAQELLFDIAVDGTITPKELSPEVEKALQEHYHFSKVDSNGKPILLDNGVPTGKVFQFHNMTYESDGKIRKLHDIIGMDSDGNLVFRGDDNAVATPAEISINNVLIEERFTGDKREAMYKFIENFIESETNDAVSRYSEFIGIVQNSQSGTKKLLAPFNNNFRGFLQEFTLNTYLSYVEQFGMFSGTISEYKNIKDTNKRAKQQTSPKQELMTVHRGSHSNIAIIGDNEIRSSLYNEIANSVGKSLQKQKEFAKLKFDVANLQKEGQQTNPLEEKIWFIVNGYQRINAADAQGYVTVAKYKAILQDAGRWDPTWQRMFEKVEKGKDLNANELVKFMQVLKPFMYDRYYDAKIGKMRSRQIKTSVLPLIPQLVRGTDMERIVKWMDKGNVQDLYFKSASKVGTGITLRITDDNGKLRDDFESRMSIETVPNKGWGLQLDVPSHLKDEHNKFGVQIARLVIANLKAEGVYKLAGTKVNGTKIKEHFHKLLSSNIEEDAVKLLKRLKAVKGSDGKWRINDIEAIKEVLESEIDSRGNLPKVYKDAIQTITENGRKEFTIPLFVASLSAKYQSLLTSLFTNNVINQKFPGGHMVVASDTFITSMNNVEDSGINFHNEVKERLDAGNFRLNYHHLNDKGDMVLTEALLPAWSKDFFVEGQRVNINDIPEDIRTMIGYRIPTEAKYSMVVFKVVGFLPESLDSTIVLPHELVAQSGWDFDVDSLYTMQREFTSELEDREYLENNEVKTRKTKAYSSAKYDDSLSETENSRAARNNRLLDIMQSILTTPEHYDELVSPGKFTDPAALKAKQEKLMGIDAENINPNTRQGQDFFRKANIAGRSLKGMAANMNSLAPVLQELQAKFTEGFYATYELDGRDTKELAKKYKGNITIEKAKERQVDMETVKQSPNYLIFEHVRKVKLNKANVEKETGYKVGVNKDINPTWVTNKSTHTIASLAEDISDLYPYMEEQQIKDTIIEMLGYNPKDYEDSLIPKPEKLGTDTAVIHQATLAHAPDGSYTNVNGDNVTEHAAQMLAMILDIVKEGLPYNINTFTFDTFMSMVYAGMPIEYAGMFMVQPVIRRFAELALNNEGILLNHKGNEYSSVKRMYQTALYKVQYYQSKFDQVDAQKRGLMSKNGNWVAKQVFVRNDETQEILGYDPGNKVIQAQSKLEAMVEFAAPKNFIGSNLSKRTPNELKKLERFYQNQLVILEQFHKFQNNGRALSEAVNTLSADKLNLQNLSNIKQWQERAAESKGIVTGNNESLYDAVYNGDAYPSLRTYKEMGIDVAYEVLQPLFIEQSNAYEKERDLILSSRNVPKNQDTTKQVNEFLNFTVLSDNPYYSQFNPRSILGIGSQVYTNIEDFDKASTANKVMLLKQLPEINSDPYNILNFMSIELSDSRIESNGFHAIKFNKPKASDNIDNEVIDSLESMLYSDDPRMITMARELVAYDFFANGATFSKSSFSNYISVAVLNDPNILNLGTQLRSAHRSANDPNYFMDLSGQDLSDAFVRNNWYDTAIVPRVFSVYARDENGNVLTFEEGGEHYPITVDDAPDWGNFDQANYISVPKKTLQKTSKEVRNAPYILISKFTADGNKTTLFKRVLTGERDFDDTYDTGLENRVFYYPVSKLGNKLLKFELRDRSLIEENNPEMTEQEYLDAIIERNETLKQLVAERNLRLDNRKNC